MASPDAARPPGKETSDDDFDATKGSSGVDRVQHPRQASGLRFYAADDALVGTSLPPVVDPKSWLIFAFRLEDAPIMIAPGAAEDVRRIAQWIARDPDQVGLLRHAVRVVLDLDLADFIDEGEAGE
jgi:hypothetical protein